MKIKVWRIRTKEGRVVIFDEEVQKLPTGEMTEFNITEKEVALLMLLYLQGQDPDQEFELIETELDEKEFLWAMDADDIHEKAVEEQHRNKGDFNA